MVTQEQLKDELEEFESVVSASELHGHLCGKLVVGFQISGPVGLKIAADYLGVTPEDIEPISETLSELTEQACAVMENDLFSFRLLLPSDEEALYVRTEALSEWCQGFLSGIGSTAGIGDTDVMKQEVETISDLVEISQISLDIEESDENEALFLEVSEYVRLAAFNLFDQFRLQDGEAVSTGVDTPIH